MRDVLRGFSPTFSLFPLWIRSVIEDMSGNVYRDIRGFVQGVNAVRAEILTIVAFVAGWALLTWGVASLLVWEVWPLSGGLFFLSLGGLRLCGDIAWHGLYHLTRDKSDG